MSVVRLDLVLLYVEGMLAALLGAVCALAAWLPGCWGVARPLCTARLLGRARLLPGCLAVGALRGRCPLRGCWGVRGHCLAAWRLGR